MCFESLQQKKAAMTDIHPFNQCYKDLILNADYEICLERAKYYTESFRQTEGQHPSIRAARALHHTLSHMALYLLDGEQIAGNRSSKTLGVVLPVERGDVNVILDMELDPLLKRNRQPFHIDPEDRRILEQDILPYWKGRTVRDRKKTAWKVNGLDFKPAINPFSLIKRKKALNLGRLRKFTGVPGTGLGYALKGMQEVLHNNPAMVMNVFDVQGHLILGLRNILAEGFAGVKARAERRLEQARRENDADGAGFLEGVIISCEAIEVLANRFAALAADKAAASPDPENKARLLAMADRCRHVPMNPPRNFHEAVQAMWLTLVGGLVSHGMVGILAIGRFDQYLYPWYAQDKAAGTLTGDQALRLMEELLIKCAANLMILPYVGKNTGNELGSDSCVPTVGGVDADGRDAANELSGIILDAFANVKSLGNSFTIRLSEKNPDWFWKKALATFRRTSGAALFNDEMVVRALECCGMPTAEARNYGVIGCVEPTGDGDTFGCTSGNDISLAAAVEMALNNGRLRVMGKRIGPATGDARKFTTFDDLMNAFKQQVAFMVDTVARAVNLKDEVYGREFHNPYISATLTGCVDNARDMTRGGAKYNFASISGRGLGTAVDSLAAVRDMVFDRKLLTMPALLDMLDANFENQEVFRQRLLHQAPKYGADNPGADAIAAEVCAFFCDQVTARRSIRNGPFRPSFFSYGMHVLEGLYIGALPNGRKAGEPVSNSLSPSNGTEKKGPTGVLRSVSRLDHSKISNGLAVNIKLSPALFAGEERLNKMVALIKGYFTEGGMELSPNVVSNRTLKEAQLHPEDYKDLVVRVSGYSALFTDLGKPLQDEIISRTEFGEI
ncbi:MAG: pyruvate formate lyase family protein [Thermodesulfobacteriota bacterium]